MNASGFSESTLKLASINVNGFRAQVINGIPKRRKIFMWLKKLNFDVILLQETHSSALDEKIWLKECAGLGFFSHGENNSRGVGILIRPSSGISAGKVFSDGEGRFITLELEYIGSHITIGNFYGPNSDNPRPIEDFCSKVDEYVNATLIIGGDFNFCLNLSKHRLSLATRVNNNNKCKDVIIKFMNDKQLVDIWRELNPYVKVYLRSYKPGQQITYRLLFDEQKFAIFQE